ncbi:MAG: hypothetical protein AB7V58_08120 [Solirubrobacterales bacterium]
MPNFPDIPGTGLVTGTGRRAGKIAVGAGLAAIAIGGYLVRRLVRGGGDEASPSADPISEPPTPQAVAEQKREEAPDAPAAPAEEAPLAPEPPPAHEEPPASDRPPATTGTDAPPKPAAEPGDRSKDEDPHHALNNPVGDPDPTEWPDPYEKRADPRDPADPDQQPFGEEPHAPTNAESTSEPHPSEDPEAGDRAAPPRRDKLDD